MPAVEVLEVLKQFRQAKLGCWVDDPQTHDRQDMARLADAFGLRLPPPYTSARRSR